MRIVGPSGCGKTTLLMKLLLDNNLVNYDKLYIFSRSMYQPEYKVIKAGLENHLPKQDILELMNSSDILKKHNATIEKLAEEQAKYNVKHNVIPSEIEYEFHETNNNIPNPQELDKTTNNLIIFDDIMTDRNQEPAANYYTRGRPANCDSIYLSQNYTHLPLHTVRSNSNFMIFLKYLQ